MRESLPHHARLLEKEGKIGDAPQFCRYRSCRRLLHNLQNSGASPIFLLSISVCTVLFLVAGCAKVGEPQPPVLLIPKPAADLAARQYADRIALTVSMPTANTDGSPVTTLQEVELFRVSESAGQLTAPLQDEEFLKRAERILSVSADKFASYLHDKTFVFMDELAAAGGSRAYGSVFDYAVRFINRKNQMAGLSNQAIITPMVIPGPPAGLTVELTQDYVRLRWIPPTANVDGSTPPRIAGYNVCRTEDPQKFPPAPLNLEPLQKPELEDRKFQFDKTYYYAVSIVGNRENPSVESNPSAPLKVVTRDTFPPGPPQNLNAVVEKDIVILLWAAPPDPDVAGYRIYRSEEGGKEKQLLQAALVNALSFRDEKAQTGKKYEYYVSAVDTHGNESAPAHTTVEVP